MVLKIRMRQQGRKGHHTYRLVVLDARTKRNGKYVEMVGWYNPHKKGNDDSLLNEDRINYWIGLGAELSEKARALVARKAPAVIKGINDRKRAKSVKLSAKRRKGKTEAATK